MGGITSLLLLLWAGVTVSTVVDLQKRITGGQTCGQNERLYHVKITDEDDKFYCGGSLINKHWILTAARCWKWGMKVVLGAHQGGGISVTIEGAPVMFASKEKRINDIMLLKLPDTITKTVPNIQSVSLPDCGKKDPKPKTVEIAGYAATGSDTGEEKVDGGTPALQCAKIDLVDCPADNHAVTYQHMLCGQTSGVETCQGDSGGGVVKDGKIYGVLVAVDKKLCYSPARFMDVCKYRDWIKDNTAESLLGKMFG